MARGLRVGDPDRPIETYGGYLGLYFDGTYSLEPILKPFLDFAWAEYRDFESELPAERTIEWFVGSKRKRLSFDRDIVDLIGFLDLFPGVRVTYDVGDDDLGPASGGTLTIWEAPRWSNQDLAEAVGNCCDALRQDFDLLKRDASIEWPRGIVPEVRATLATAQARQRRHSADTSNDVPAGFPKVLPRNAVFLGSLSVGGDSPVAAPATHYLLSKTRRGPSWVLWQRILPNHARDREERTFVLAWCKCRNESPRTAAEALLIGAWARDAAVGDEIRSQRITETGSRSGLLNCETFQRAANAAVAVAKTSQRL